MPITTPDPSGREGRLMRSLLWIAVILSVAVFMLFQRTELDLGLQDHFYRFDSHTWLVDEKAFWPRLCCYILPKAAIILLGVALFAAALFHRRLSHPLLPSRSSLWIALLTLACAPALINVAKATTDVYCPYQIVRYGGEAPYHKPFESWPQGQHPHERGRGFPAGHASGGFALIGLFALCRSRRVRLGAILLSQGLGWWMGGYQMLRGAHYLSHTVLSDLICVIVFLGLSLLVRRWLPERGTEAAC